MNELIYKTDCCYVKNKFVGFKGESGGVGEQRNSEFEVNIFAVLYIKQMNSKDQLVAQ